MLGIGIVFFVATVGMLSAYVAGGNSFPSMVWNFADPRILKGMADGPAAIALMGLSAIALSVVGRGRPQRVSMAAWALRSGKWALVFAGLLTSLMAILFACRQVLFPGL